jgi:hypothetical protein
MRRVFDCIEKVAIDEGLITGGNDLVSMAYCEREEVFKAAYDKLLPQIRVSPKRKNGFLRYLTVYKLMSTSAKCMEDTSDVEESVDDKSYVSC